MDNKFILRQNHRKLHMRCVRKRKNSINKEKSQLLSKIIITTDKSNEIKECTSSELVDTNEVKEESIFLERCSENDDSSSENENDAFESGHNIDNGNTSSESTITKILKDFFKEYCYQEDENLVATKFNAKDDSENVLPNTAQFQRPSSITMNKQQNFANIPQLDSSLSNVASEAIDSIPEVSKKNCVESGLKEMLQDLFSTLTANIKKEVKASTDKIIKKLNDIDVKQSELYLRVQHLENKLEETLNTKIVENFVTLQNISDKYKIQFPFTENNDFQTFNDTLKDDVDLKADLDKFIKCNIIMQKTMSNNLTDIFKQMFTKCVLTQYTAQIATDVKPAMCNTTFFKCVQDAILSKYKQSNQQIDVKNIKQALGQIINNAYDWEGGRLERGLKRKKNMLIVMNKKNVT